MVDNKTMLLLALAEVLIEKFPKLEDELNYKAKKYEELIKSEEIFNDALSRLGLYDFIL